MKSWEVDRNRGGMLSSVGSPFENRNGERVTVESLMKLLVK
jgi:hypothetical protein